MSKFLAVRHALWFKLTAAFLLTAVVGIVTVALLANRATAVGFHAYLNEDKAAEWSTLQDQLARSYAQLGDWSGAEQILIAGRPGRGKGGGALTLLDEEGAIAAFAGNENNLPTSPDDAAVSVPILADGSQIGTLLVREPGAQGSRAAEIFLEAVNRAIWWGGLVAVSLALFLGLFFARRLTRPLRQLTEAAQSVAEGELGQRVTVNSTGEMGELAANFNQMSAALALAEERRQQMLADVAHELRTPISIMRGHIEAMLDGVFETTPDNLALIHEETLLLGRLVEDLRTLSLAEAGALSLNLIDLDLAALAATAVAAFEPLAEAENIRLAIDLPSSPLIINADSSRIRQVLGNLLSNALRHAPQGGTDSPQVRVVLGMQDGKALISVTDNGAGLSPEAQRHVFDRFWRAEDSRARDYGGSGLGLPICKAIVGAHNGRMWVESPPNEGASFRIELPIIGHGSKTQQFPLQSAGAGRAG